MRPRHPPDRRSLSTRQEEIAYLLSDRSFKEIGDLLGLSERTVKYHVDHMRSVYNAPSRRVLIRMLREEGIIE